MLNRYHPLLLAPLALSLMVQPAQSQEMNHDFQRGHIQHVLLISIDGMHSADFLNCTKGISGVDNGTTYCPAIKALAETGVNYLDAATSKPSDSFPGLMSIVTGGSPRTVGAFYDVAYDRSLDAPAKTTGNGVAAGTCVAGQPATGTRTEYEEGIDLDQSQVNGGGDSGIGSIDSSRLPRDPKNNCAPVFPWNFVRTNTIFGVIHGAGGYTAWSDKHPAYSAVSGPGNGKNVDDFYGPEINSTVVGLPGVKTVLGRNCTNVPDPSQTGAWTDSFLNIRCYDTLKVDAVLNEIDGKTHDGKRAQVPNILGMNFQTVSVGQKLIEPGYGTGGYLDAEGTPAPNTVQAIRFTDASIGRMVEELKNRDLYGTTLIIITAKHGQSPIDPKRYLPIPGHSGTNGTTPATLINAYLPYSESPLNPTGIGATEDDVSLLWLADQSKTADAVAVLEQNATQAGIGQIYYGRSLEPQFNSPTIDPRTPDIIVTPNIGVTYTGSTAKQAEHGGFAHDDTNVMLLISHPDLDQSTIDVHVETTQIAPTILKAFHLDPSALDAVRIEGTPVLPGLRFETE